MTIVRFDGFVTDMQNGTYLNDHQFTLKDSEGKDGPGFLWMGDI